jgi:hypothetical protein
MDANRVGEPLLTHGHKRRAVSVVQFGAPAPAISGEEHARGQHIESALLLVLLGINFAAAHVRLFCARPVSRLM